MGFVGAGRSVGVGKFLVGGGDAGEGRGGLGAWVGNFVGWAGHLRLLVGIYQGGGDDGLEGGELGGVEGV